MEHYQQGQENMTSHPNSGSQPRRGLAVNDMLNSPSPSPSSQSVPSMLPWPGRQPLPDPRSTDVHSPFGHFPHPPRDLSERSARTYLPTSHHQPSYLPPPSFHPDPGFIMDPRRRLAPSALPPLNINNQPNEYQSHMTHSGWAPGQIQNTYQDPGLRLPALHIQEPVRMANPTVVRPTKSCMICLDAYVGDEVESMFPHSCAICTAGNYCSKCLKDWFLDACKNESKMPPKCCTAIPLSTMVGHLDAAQIELFKAKFEEWSTAERIYCPVPSCSAFIPPRLYVEPMRGNLTPSPPHMQKENGPAARELRAKRASNHIAAPVATKPSVSCPDCHTLVCTKCRASLHLGECPQTDLDPALEEQLKKWKIKRCPKCRTGVRKVFGCSHVECRCGAHFCYECLLPFTECDGQCEDESDAEPNEEDLDEDDIDGRAGFYDGDGHEFGDEPYGSTIDTWGCLHSWSTSRSTTTDPLLRPRQLECHRCFRAVHIFDEEREVKRSSDGDVEMGGMPEPAWPMNMFDEPAWQCFSGHMKCDRCPKDAPNQRLFDASWMWRCNCGMECWKCDKNQAVAHKAKEDGVAWECRCGMMICQACKKFVPDD